MAVCKSGWSVNKFCSIERPGRINQMTATYFSIASRGQLSADQVSFIRKEKKSATLRRDVNARAVSLCSHAIRAPNLPAGGRFEAYQPASGPGAIDVFALQLRSRGVDLERFRVHAI